MQNLAYRIGKFFGSLPTIARASLVLLVCVGVFWFFTQDKPKTETSVVQPVVITPPKKGEQTGSCSEVERHNFQAFIVHSGAQCATVDFCSSLSPVDARITCNGNQFAYRVKDHGKGFVLDKD